MDRPQRQRRPVQRYGEWEYPNEHHGNVQESVQFLESEIAKISAEINQYESILSQRQTGFTHSTPFSGVPNSGVSSSVVCGTAAAASGDHRGAYVSRPIGDAYNYGNLNNMETRSRVTMGVSSPNMVHHNAQHVITPMPLNSVRSSVVHSPNPVFSVIQSSPNVSWDPSSIHHMRSTEPVVTRTSGHVSFVENGHVSFVENVNAPLPDYWVTRAHPPHINTVPAVRQPIMSVGNSVPFNVHRSVHNSVPLNGSVHNSAPFNINSNRIMTDNLVTVPSIPQQYQHVDSSNVPASIPQQYQHVDSSNVSASVPQRYQYVDSHNVPEPVSVSNNNTMFTMSTPYNDRQQIQPVVVSQSSQPVVSPSDRMAKLMYLNSITPIKFSGLPIDYPAFEKRIRVNLDDGIMSNEEKLEYLPKFVCDEAEHLLLSLRGRSFSSIMGRIKERFGHPALVAKSFVAKLTNGPSIKPFEIDKLQDIADLLTSASETLDGQYLSDAGCAPNIVKIIDRLPQYIKNDWEKKVLDIVGNKSAPDLLDLAKFVDKHARAKNNPFYSTSQMDKIPQDQPVLRTGQQRAGQRPAGRPAGPPPGNRPIWSGATNTGQQQQPVNPRFFPQPGRQGQFICEFCKRYNHRIWKCYAFLNLNHRARFNFVINRGLCFVCLQENCISSKCSKIGDENIACVRCEKPHNKLLECKKPVYESSTTDTQYRQISTDDAQNKQNITSSNQSDSNNNPSDNRGENNNVHPDESVVHSKSCNFKNADLFMMTILPVKVHGKNGKVISTYAFLDSGSQASFINEDLAQKLELEGPIETRYVSTVNDKIKQKLQKVSFTLSSIDSDFSCVVDDYSFVMMDVNLPQQLGCMTPDKFDFSKYEHLQKFNLPTVDVKTVSILLGLPVFQAHQVLEYYCGKAKEPYCVKTQLGMAIVGPLAQSESGTTLGCKITKVKNGLSNDDISELDRFCQVEDIGVIYPPRMSLSANDQKAMDRFRNTLNQRIDKHYESGLLWEDVDCVLPYNRATAEKRLKALIRKFKADPPYMEMYVRAMNNHISKGWASVSPPEEAKIIRPKTFFVSHFGITNVNKPGKVQPVFDLAEKTDGVCLNDMLLSGPDSTSSLVGVLIRSRFGIICVASDVAAMFFQCYVIEQDRDSLRFLWFADGDPNNDVVEYKMNVHVFGASDSPCVANNILRQISEDYGYKYDPKVVEAAQNSFYVDDSLVSSGSSETAINTSKGLKDLLSEGGFELGKFKSNDRSVLEALDSSLLACPEVNLDSMLNGVERILGLKWDLKSDSLCFKIRDNDKPATLRGILGVTARVYDPLGFVSPVILVARLIIRKCWEAKLGWDDPLPNDIANMWSRWINKLPLIENLRIPRPYFSELDCLSSEHYVELHVFADSSSYATGCATYLRVETDKNNYVSFVYGKARLHPKKPILTIPRAELKAAVEAVRISEMLKSELHLDISRERIYFWTDSEICLKYIKNESRRCQVYVANRQSEIRQFTAIDQWHFCPGTVNPADYPSRGVNPELFTSDHHFLRGPEFLRGPKCDWPISEINPHLTDDDPEVKSFVTVINEKDYNTVIALVNRGISLSTIVMITGKLLRRLKRIRNKTNEANIVSKILKRSERETAEITLVKVFQSAHYETEIKSLKEHKSISRSSNILSLNPFLDDNEVLRVGGRLRNADIGYADKHPAILPSPKTCKFSATLLNYYHKILAHGGQEMILAKAREKYWIIHARSFVRQLIHLCVSCRKRNAKALVQIMGDLPSERLAINEPCFSYTGTDAFGPIYCKDKRSILKYYGVIFMCLTTSAIHIEGVKFLDTDDFICALMRFTALRGGVKEIRSDNGSNFIGAEKELRELVQAWDSERITSEMAVKGVDWNFQPPYASSQSGVWERRVKESKRHLYAILEKSTPSPDVFRTTLYEVASIMNQAPLCAVSSDPESYGVLTPAHFMFAKSVTVLVPVPTEENAIYKKKWRQVQQLLDAYWKRFVKNYVPTLLSRKKWKLKTRNLKINDLVLLVNLDLPRSRWAYGRVVEIMVGKDGYVRSANVRTQSGTYYRPIQKLALIMTEEELMKN